MGPLHLLQDEVKTQNNPPTIPPSTLSLHWDTTAPSAPQLSSATHLFTSTHPRFLHSASQFRTLSLSSPLPEVAFLGRSNVGKSSLLNAVLGTAISRTSSKPGRTKTMNVFEILGGRAVVLDMPGYGKGSHEGWGAEIMKYLVGRKQLRRVFVLIDPLHGPKQTDIAFLHLLRTSHIPHQILLPKVDRILFPKGRRRLPSRPVLEHNIERLGEIMAALRETVQPEGERRPGALGEIVACSAEWGVDWGGRGREKLGISGVRWAVMVAAGIKGVEGRVSRVTDVEREEQTRGDMGND
ncbi:MAG: GTP-binding protein [Caeruleum heppii]|nr:MAG: GTP-binding protein [Caeruleum heppii]